MKQNFSAFLLFLLLLNRFFGFDLIAQDAHYWSNQYGTRADLLGGIVIGSVKDLSSVYYNPGAVSFGAEKSLIITTHAFDVTYMSFDLPIADAEDYNVLKTRVAPIIFAVRLNDVGRSKHNFVISYLEKEDLEKEINLLNLPYGLDEETPSFLDKLYNEITLYQQISEHWGGLTWSYTYNKNLGIGITLYGAYRHEVFKSRFALQQIDTTNSGTAVDQRADYEMNHIRLFGKIGIFYEEDTFSLGLTMILPGVGIYGWGEILYLNSIINYRGFESQRESSIINIIQSSLNANYMYPFSIGFGGSYSLGNTTLHFSAEWFKNVPLYKTLDTNPVRNPYDNELIELDIYSGARSVINYGFGFQHHFDKKDVDIYFAFRTDFSSQSDSDYETFSISRYNKYHITTGAAYKVFDYYITSGISFGFGSTNSASFFSTIFPDPLPEESSASDDINILYRNFKFIIGFSF